MRPTTAFNENIIDFNALLHPGTVFNHPKDVLAHPSLSVGEKRAILASWASDASAIASCPSLRAPAGLKAPVTIDEILEALCELDGGPRQPPGGKPNRLRRRGRWQPDKVSAPPTRARVSGLRKVSESTYAAAASPRVLEDLFWLGRYAERTEDLTRLLIPAGNATAHQRKRPYPCGRGETQPIA